MQEGRCGASVSDVTALLWCSAIKELLTVNGFTEKGSHYDVFSKICLSADRDGQSVAVRKAEEQLSDLLGEPVLLSFQACSDLWCRVADLLLLDPSAAIKHGPCSFVKPFLPPSNLFIQAPHCVELSSLFSIDCKTWREWEARAAHELQASCSNGVHPRLSLSRSFSPIKPSLYRVERILSKDEGNEDLWQTQMAYFLFRFCETNGIRPVIATECAPEKLAELLKILEKLTPLCNFIWQPSGENVSVLHKVCRLVMCARRNCGEGDPPVLIAKA